MSLENFASRGLKAQAAVDELAEISVSDDVAWLRAMMGNKDNQVTMRNAAHRRLRILMKGKRRK